MDLRWIIFWRGGKESDWLLPLKVNERDTKLKILSTLRSPNQ